MRSWPSCLALAVMLLACGAPAGRAQDAASSKAPLFDFGIGAGVLKPALHGRAAEIWSSVGSMAAAPAASVHFALGGENVRAGFELGAGTSSIGEHDARLFGGGIYLRWLTRAPLAGWRPELQAGYSRLLIVVGNMHVSELPEIYEGREIPPNRERTYPRMFGNGLGGGITLVRPLTASVALGLAARSSVFSLTQTFTNPDPSRGPLRESGRATSHSLSLLLRWGR